MPKPDQANQKINDLKRFVDELNEIAPSVCEMIRQGKSKLHQGKISIHTEPSINFDDWSNVGSIDKKAGNKTIAIRLNIILADGNHYPDEMTADEILKKFGVKVIE